MRKQVTSKNEQEFSKFLSYILRHKPEDIGLRLEDNGWISVKDLIIAINHHEASKWEIDMKMLEQIVANDKKKRYSFNINRTKIRANQGHSIKDLNMEFKEVEQLPKYLFHGTSKENAKLIMQDGVIKPMSRTMVHLSDNAHTAMDVGRRHGKPVVFIIDTEKATADNIKFYISENGVYLVEKLDKRYFVFDIRS